MWSTICQRILKKKTLDASSKKETHGVGHLFRVNSHSYFLVGGFRPFEKYESTWSISPGRGENKQYLKHHLDVVFP